jgi:trimeric autotransporter adhesin
MATLHLKRLFTEAFRRGRRPGTIWPRLHSLEARLAPAAHVVADINTTLNPYGSYPRDFTNSGGETYFTAVDSVHGRELWRTNGTTGGTVLVKDIHPGSFGGYPFYLADVGGELFFIAQEYPNFRPALWKTDGTEAGTVLVKDFSASQYAQYPQYLTGVNGILFFALAGPGGAELWTSDGTEAGTVVVKDINPGPDGSYPQQLVAFNGALYFVADDGTNGEELWTSDGTEAGTVMVTDLEALGGSFPRSLTVVNGKLYFSAYTTTAGTELWASDGTEAGTAQVADINPTTDGSYPTNLTAANGTLFFMANDGANGTELWKTNAGGTALVKDLAAGSASSTLYELTAVNGNVFFSANDGTNGFELWTSDGTEAGTVLVKDIDTDNAALYPGSYPRYLAAFNGELYFAATEPGPNFGLWKSDGTTAGTELVKIVLPGQYSDAVPSYLFDSYGTLLFRVNDGFHGPELWTSDGTADGTELLKDVLGGTADSTPRYLTDMGGEIYFTADDGVNGRELWKSDGTVGGTSMVKDILPGPDFGYILDLKNVDGTLFLRADDGVNGAELWLSDGTEAGTVLVKDINGGPAPSHPSQMANLNGKLVFTANDGGPTGRELWISDGTEAGTTLLKDVRPGPNTSFIENLTVIGGVLYFTANDGTHSRELWTSDGTEAGTVMVKDIFPNFYSSDPDDLTEFDGELYFAARNGTNGRELWKTDGTEAGTVLVKDIQPAGGAYTSSYPSYFINAGDALYFGAYDDANGRELWKTDGTEAGTVLVADIVPGSYGSFASPLAALNGTVYIHATDGTGYELWKADTGGVSKVKDISDGAIGSQPGYLTVYHGKLYFTAFNETSGRELWVTDGTEAGTKVAAQTVAGTGDGMPSQLTVSGDRLYFTAYSATQGNELWTFTDEPDLTPPTVTIDQAPGQSDPAETGPVRFRVVFSEPVNGFDQSGVDLTGSNVPGTLAKIVSEVGLRDGTTYEVTVTGMVSDGDVVATVRPSAAKDEAGNDSLASTSSDNKVRFAVRPTVTVEQASGQADPTTTGPIVFNVVFSEDVTGFDGTKVDLSQSTVAGTATAAVILLTPSTYRVEVTGMAGVGKVIARILADQVTDAAGNGNLASTSADNQVNFYGGGTIGFSSAVLDTVDEGIGIYKVKVHRVGSVGAVTATFSIAAGTATAADFADTNVSHTLQWLSGDNTDKEFTIQVVNDTISEARETINVGLSNIVGAVASITAATVGIDYNDPLKSGESFVESDGDKVTLKLSPATVGTLQYYLTDGAEPIDRIVLTNTSSTKSTVTLSVKKASGANGTTDVREVIGSGVKTLNLAKANLSGVGINLGGPLGSLTVGNVSSGADILAAGNKSLKTTIKAGAIGDGTVVNVGNNLTSFTAASVGDSDILAPSIGTLLVKGNFSGDVTINGSGVAAGKPALRTFRVLGAVSNSEIDVTGSVSAVTVGSFTNSHLFAGLTGPVGPGAFTTGAAIASFQTTSKAGTFANSSVAADVIKSVSLWNVTGGNGGTPFGVFADTSIGTVKIRSTGTVYRNPTDDGFQDFKVKVE